MKTKLIILTLAIVSCILTTTTVFAQTIYTWTGAGDETNIANAANWSPAGGPPNGNTQDIGQWDGVAPGNLTITYTAAGGLPGTGFGTQGVNWNLTSNQAGSVTIISPNDNSQNIGFYNITVASGAGALTLGDNTTNENGFFHQLNLIARPAGALHAMVNNSTNPATIDPSVWWQAGGGSAYILDFGGTGNWVVNNYLRPGDSGPTTIALEGPGNLIWSAAGIRADAPTGPIIINGGTMILKSANLVPFEYPTTVPNGNNTIVNNGTSLEFDAPAQSDTIARVISGTGMLKVSNGTLTLSGANTYTGGTLISGGTLQVVTNSSLGTGNVTNNGALVFNLPNNDFININNNISGSGSVSNIGLGVCTLFGSNTYSGGTTISAGYLVFRGVKTGTGNITVADSAALDVFDTGTQVTPNTLTLGSNAGCTLDFYLNGSTSTAIISAGTLSSAGTITVNIDNSPPPLTVGQSYPLLTWASGPAPAVHLGVLNFFVGNLSIIGNTLWLNITGTVTGTVYTWTGAGFAKTNVALAQNWTTNGITAATTLPSGLTQDTAGWDGLTTSNLVLIYGTNIGNGFPNTGLGTFGIHLDLTANQTNSVQIISALPVSPPVGLFSISNSSPNSPLILGDTSANNLAIITRPGAQKVVHPFVNNSTAACVINPSVKWSAGGGVGTTYDFSGTGNWIANNYLMPDNGANASTVQVDGPGLVIWSAGSTGLYIPNSQLTNIVINGGALILKSAFPGNSDQLRKTAIANSATLTYDPVNPDSQTLSGVISGTGLLQVNNGTLTLSGANTYTGGTTISGGTLQVGTNGTSGSLGCGNVTNNSSLIFNHSDNVTFGSAISGTGSVVQNGSGTLTLNGANTYTGATTVSNGTLVVNSVSGDMNVSGGTLAPGNGGSVSTLNVTGNLTISSGTLLASLNKSMSPSNSLVSVAGAINYAGGTLKLLNFGPGLAVGDKFTIFNKSITGGNAMTIISPGFTVANNLAADGSVTVASVAPPETGQITVTLLSGQLNLSWPTAWTGLHLQFQTSPLTTGLSTNWVTIPGTSTGNSYSNLVNATNGCAFYRLSP